MRIDPLIRFHPLSSAAPLLTHYAREARSDIICSLSVLWQFAARFAVILITEILLPFRRHQVAVVRHDEAVGEAESVTREVIEVENSVRASSFPGKTDAAQ